MFCSSLGAEDGEFGQGRVQHLLLQGPVVAEEVAEQGDQDQQQGQEGEEAVVGQQGGEVAALVVAELLHHCEGHAGPGVLLLVAVDAPQHLFGRVHRVPP